MKISLYITDTSGKRLSFDGSYEMEYNNVDIVESQNHEGDVEADLINIHANVEYQTVGGIGGAFTDSCAGALSALSDDKKEEFIKAYFDGEEGINYTFGRLSIGSCDFSTEDYTYVDENDLELSSFDLSHDIDSVFPMIHSAMKYNDVTLFASPWSPPAYMKTSLSRIGGHLDKDYYTLYAKYLRKYIKECKKNGIDIFGITLQNEPRHHQIWESCLYTIEEEIELLGYVGKELEGMGVKIFCYDHCRERIMDRACAIFDSENGKYCDGIANHWYSGPHFGELRAFNKLFPDKLSIASEGCCVARAGEDHKPLELGFAEDYAFDICGSFNNGLNYYCDWNLALNENYGPHHNREGRKYVAYVPVCLNSEKNEVERRLAYYYIGHYSKFIKKGSKVIATSSYTDELMTVGFKNPDGSISVVILNKTDKSFKFRLRCNGYLKSVVMTPHSIITAVIMK